MRRHALPIAVFLAASSNLIGMGPALAASQPATCPDGTQVQVQVDVTAGPDAFNIAYAAACAGHMGERTDDDEDGTDPVSTEPAGTWVYAGPACDNGGMCNSQQVCADGSVKKLYYFIDAAGNRGDLVAYCPGDPAEPKVKAPTPDQIFTAFKEKAPIASTLSIQPPNGQTLVNFETIFSTKADPFTTQPFELVRGYTVELDIFPTAFYWNFGDGADLRTDSPGKAWESGDDVSTLITHVYTSTDPVKASVTTRWGANVRLNGGAPVAVEGTVDTTSEPVPLEILEAVPELVK